MQSKLNHTNTEPKNNFVPNMDIITRIMNILLEQSSIGRTELCQIANLHYGRLSKYLYWLKKKSLIEFVAADEKIVIRLTTNGRNFILLMSAESK